MEITPKPAVQPLCGTHPPVPASEPVQILPQPGSSAPVPVVPPDSSITAQVARASKMELTKTVDQLKMIQAKKDAMEFARKDGDDDGQISESEYGIVPGDNDGENWQLNQQRKQEFRMADKNHDGQLSHQEYQAMLKEKRTLDIDPGARPLREG